MFIDLGSNRLGDELSKLAVRFQESLPDRIEEISIDLLWSRGLSLSCILKAHDLVMEHIKTGIEERQLDRLDIGVAERLRDVVLTWKKFVNEIKDEQGHYPSEKAPDRNDVEEAKQVNAAAVAIVTEIRASEIATPAAKEAVGEQAQAAKEAPDGLEGDQAKVLSSKTIKNFVATLLRGAYAPIKTEAAFAWKEYRGKFYGAAAAATASGIGYAAYNNWPAIVSFVVRHADALKEFVSTAWHDPTLVEIVNSIVRFSGGF